MGSVVTSVRFGATAVAVAISSLIFTFGAAAHEGDASKVHGCGLRRDHKRDN